MIAEPKVLERLENATCILFGVVAEQVYKEARQFVPANDPFDFLNQEETVCHFLINKVVDLVQKNESFKKQICGDNGREWTYAFFRHWISALLISSYGVEAAAIPDKFKIGNYE